MSRAGTINAFGIYEFGSAETGRISVRNTLGDGYRLAWLPDSRRVVVVDRGSRIHLVDTQTGRQRTLLEGSPWRFWGNVPPIAPDGRTIYLDRALAPASANNSVTGFSLPSVDFDDDHSTR